MSSSSSDGEPSRFFSVDRIITFLSDYYSQDSSSSMDIVRWVSIEYVEITKGLDNEIAITGNDGFCLEYSIGI
ncbi:hypothetical protein J5N97_027678 [Dioscorea zingiberensis]|uniref:Uncharacterized protein n=1 Tax=Dioscorea zingiberensis TaxID=325984 RepID=A0A9D5BXC3_9LILI|nr:hypothetical protein J5N97_027678 [Dioscorea zingiberensis]